MRKEFSKPDMNIRLEILKKLKKVEIASDGCWIYAVKENTYPTLRYKGKQEKLSRLVVKHIKEEVIPEGYVAGHKCDNKRCLNPEHLEVITNKQNVQDGHKRVRGYDQFRIKLERERLRGLPKPPEEKKGLDLVTEIAEVEDLKQRGLSVKRIAEETGLFEEEVDELLEEPESDFYFAEPDFHELQEGDLGYDGKYFDDYS